MVFEKAKGGTTRQKPLYALRLNFDEDGALNGKRGMGLPKEGHHSKGGGLKVRQPLSFVRITNVLLKVPPNHQKELS
jgi:hypothetical protein